MSKCVLFGLLSCVWLTTAAWAGDLHRLPYNDRELTVDLGVGLWSWPLPMDFDGDGDLDLVVVCPDKPYNGTYLFETPGGDAKMPVFKPARRLSQGLSNVSPSYIDGQVHILSPGLKHPNFLQTGLAERVKLPIPHNVHPNQVRANQWKLLDYDGDGVLDLVIGVGDWTDYGWDNAYDREGNWTNGPLRGLIYVAINSRTTERPTYNKPELITLADGQPVEVYGRPSPNFADFDGDGDLDLLCGEFFDGFTYFENIGTRTEPRYAAGRRLMHDGRPLTMDLQMIVPVAIDWTGDGYLDLIVGDEDGRVALIENTGRLVEGVPQFLPPEYFQQEAADVKCGALATPFAFDWDGDGDEDLLVGNTAGYLCFYENLSGPGVEQPRWAAPRYLNAGGERIRIQAGPNGSIQGPCEAKWGYTTLNVADWDHDGLPDVIVNSIWGRVLWYRNVGIRTDPQLAEAQPIRVAWQGTPPKPAWNWWDPVDDELVTQWRTTPVVIDFDGDGLNDLVMLDHEGYLAFFRRQQNDNELMLLPGQRIFVDEQGAPLQLNSEEAGKSGRVKLAVVDWDGDGRLDLVVNSVNAGWYRQVENSGGKYVYRAMGDLGKQLLAGHSTSPTIVDWNANGVPDLLVGAEDGRLYYKRNPRSEQPGIVSREFVYDVAPFAECHASTIIETAHGLLATWFGGTHEKHADVGIWISHRTDDVWSDPVEVSNGVQADGTRYPTWNPVLFRPQEGPLTLYYKVGPDPRTWWGMAITSDDEGKTWSSPQRLPEGVLGPIKNKPVQLVDGTILSPSSSEHDGWRVHFERSSDGGKSWQVIGPVSDGKAFSAIQPSILIHTDGRLQALGRTRQGRIFDIWSDDKGQTWGPLTAGSLPNPNSGTDAVTLADGRHLLIYNHTSRGRSPLNLAVSDDGQAWHAALVLEREPGEYSYPAIIQTADGLVHVTYTWKRQRVMHAVIDPERLETQPIVDGVWPEPRPRHQRSEPPVIESSWDDLLPEDLSTPEAWTRHRLVLEQRYLELIRDQFKPARPALDITVHEKTVVDNQYTRALISYQVERDERAHAYLGIPLGLTDKAPAVVALHGTFEKGIEQAAGLVDNPDKAYLDHLCRRGYVVIAPEHFVSGRRTPPEGAYDTSRFYARHPQWTAVGKFTYEHSIAVDVLLTLEEVDPSRVGAMGHSLGGHGTMFLAAYDPRIRAAAGNCAASFFRHNAGVEHWSRDRWYVYFGHLRPGLLRGELPPIDFHEIMALIAPRAYLDVSALNDGAALTQRQRALMLLKVGDVFELLGVPENFAFFIHGRGHAVPHESRELIYGFLDVHLKPPVLTATHRVDE